MKLNQSDVIVKAESSSNVARILSVIEEIMDRNFKQGTV